MSKTKNPSFEQCMQQLEQLVQRMDSGDLPLEESLAAFEQGIGLVKQCQVQLQQAEQKVQQLLDNNGELQIKPLEKNKAQASSLNDLDDDIPF